MVHNPNLICGPMIGDRSVKELVEVLMADPSSSDNESKGGNWWNPFQTVESKAQAIDMTKGGAVVGGWLAVSGLMFAGIAYWGDLEFVDEFERWGMIIVYLFQVILGAVLGYVVYRFQWMWAVILLGGWALLEIVVKIFSWASGESRFSITIVIFAAITLVMLRGSFALRRFLREEDHKRPQTY